MKKPRVVGRTDKRVTLSAKLWSRMAEAARAEGKTTDELLEEAALRLLQRRELRLFVDQNRELAEERGLTEADVPRLIAESRNQRSGR
jgi:hypothetical protein